METLTCLWQTLILLHFFLLYPINIHMFFDRFTKLAVGNKQPHVQYETTIYRLEKTTLT